jgi:hypothetical protein
MAPQVLEHPGTRPTETGERDCGHQNYPRRPPRSSPECIHCYGSGWILDPTEEDEDRAFPCHMCDVGDDAGEDL